MSLHKYALACTNIESELKGSLTKEEINDLRKRCAEYGLGGCLRWIEANLAVIDAYIKAPPSRRRNLKSWNEPDVKGLLVFGALWQVRCARVLLTTLAQTWS